LLRFASLMSFPLLATAERHRGYLVRCAAAATI
jgi:hypothetical protein